MADIDEGRLKFAAANGYADFTYKVEPKRGAEISECLSIAKTTASEINVLSSSTDPNLKPKYVFECTGAESCVQASIYVSKLSQS